MYVCVCVPTGYQRSSKSRIDFPLHSPLSQPHRPVYDRHTGLAYGDMAWPEAMEASDYDNAIDSAAWAALKEQRPVIEGFLLKRAVKSGKNFRQR